MKLFVRVGSAALTVASHIIRIPAIGGKLLSVRNKSRHYVTHSGRTVVVKDDVVYTNKGGFKLAS
jgi:hypothetical protein